MPVKFMGENDIFFGLKIFPGALRNTRKSFRELCGMDAGLEKFSGLLINTRLFSTS